MRRSEFCLCFSAWAVIFGWEMFFIPGMSVGWLVAVMLITGLFVFFCFTLFKDLI